MEIKMDLMYRKSRSRNPADNGNRCGGADRLAQPYPPKKNASPALAQLAFIFQKHEFLIKTVSWNMSEIIK